RQGGVYGRVHADKAPAAVRLRGAGIPDRGNLGTRDSNGACLQLITPCCGQHVDAGHVYFSYSSVKHQGRGSGRITESSSIGGNAQVANSSGAVEYIQVKIVKINRIGIAGGLHLFFNPVSSIVISKK